MKSLTGFIFLVLSFFSFAKDSRPFGQYPGASNSLSNIAPAQVTYKSIAFEYNKQPHTINIKTIIVCDLNGCVKKNEVIHFLPTGESQVSYIESDFDIAEDNKCKTNECTMISLTDSKNHQATMHLENNFINDKNIICDQTGCWPMQETTLEGELDGIKYKQLLSLFKLDESKKHMTLTNTSKKDSLNQSTDEKRSSSIKKSLENDSVIKEGVSLSM